MAMMTEAFGKIRGIMSSYLTHPNMLKAKSIASQLARSPAVMGGAAVGAATGAGYDYSTNNRSGIGSRIGAGIRGGLLGAGAGAAYKGYGMMGGKAGMLHQYGRASGAAMRGINSGIPKALHNYGRGVSAVTKGYDAAKYYAGL